MKRPRLTKLINQYIKAEFPGYRQSRNLFIKDPVEYVLRGYSFGSGFYGTDVLYVSYFYQPLYVPLEFAHVSFGDRVAEVDVTAESEASVMMEVLDAMKRAEHYVDRYPDPASLAHNKWRFGDGTERAQEVTAYSLVLAGDYREAETSLEKLRAELLRDIPKFPLASWLPDMEARVGKLLDALRQDPEQAVALLNEWTEYTKRNLKLA
jgi:hypothetical protein